MRALPAKVVVEAVQPGWSKVVVEAVQRVSNPYGYSPRTNQLTGLVIQANEKSSLEDLCKYGCTKSLYVTRKKFLHACKARVTAALSKRTFALVDTKTCSSERRDTLHECSLSMYGQVSHSSLEILTSQ